MANLSWVVDGKEVPTKAMYGVFQIFKRIERGSKIVFCADRRSVRKDVSEDYKKGRKPPDEDYIYQENEVERILRESRYNLLAEEGMEADDLIGSVVTKYSDKYDKVLVWTNDRDLCYLINDKVEYKSLITSLPDINVDNYEKVLKVPYNTISLFKATVGDSSDKIAGVRGFGMGSFDNLIEFCINMGIELEDVVGNEEEIIKKFFDGRDAQIKQGLESLSLVKPILKDVTIEDREDSGNLRVELHRYGMKSVEARV